MLSWSIHPFKNSLKESSLVILFLLFTTIVVFLALPNIIITFALMFLVIISLRGFFFKTTYSLNSEALNIKMLTFEYSKKFVDFKRVYISEDAFLISPFTYKTRLNKYRGVYANFPKELKEEIEVLFKNKLEIINQKNK